jgi:malate permease and related proteins
MQDLDTQLIQLYLKLISGVLVGWCLGRLCPPSLPEKIGHFLFWIGVPLSIIAFLRQTDLSGQIWLAPVVAWVASILGVAIAWGWLKGRKILVNDPPARGSLLLASMVGNTGYLGYPITLAIVGETYFAWALFYDLLGTLLAAYILGVLVAAYYGGQDKEYKSLLTSLINNPALWSLAIGLVLKLFTFPPIVERGLVLSGWSMIVLCLVLLGMRLSQIHSWQLIPKVSISLIIKMLLVPLFLGLILAQFGIAGSPLLVLVLQMAMPPAFATLVLSEAFDLDREFTVTALAGGAVVLLVMLPFWLFLFN